MVEIILVSALSLIMLSWNVYLMRQNQELVNKLMSRNYGEYATAKKFEAKTVENEEKIEVVDPYDAQRARELNGVLGI